MMFRATMLIAEGFEGWSVYHHHPRAYARDGDYASILQILQMGVMCVKD